MQKCTPCYEKSKLKAYSPRPHPVKLNNLPQHKARLKPQAGRPGSGLSPPTHCQLGCFSKARKRVTLASHIPHTPTYINKHTPQMTPTLHPYVSVISCLFGPTFKLHPRFPSHLPPFLPALSASHCILVLFSHRILQQGEDLFNPTLTLHQY